MAANIEIKIRCKDLEPVERACGQMGIAVDRVLVQTDTYFHVRSGRLKLREIEPDQAELIWYVRPNHAGSRLSEYIKSAVAEPVQIRLSLGQALGVRCVIRKRRRLLLWQNVRVHLDDVDGLGSFVEFEAVLSPSELEAESCARIAELMVRLNLSDAEVVGSSYSDLMLASV